jgi:hypothetical protein
VSVGLTYARSTVSRDTRARATGGSWFSAGGAITMRATSRNTADADMMGGAIGAIAALYMNPKATISGATEALFSAGVAASGALVVDAQGRTACAPTRSPRASAGSARSRASTSRPA